jgi:predicted CopG family antitoxin
MKTTIQIEKEVKSELEKMKTFPRESFNSVIKRLIESKTDDIPLSSETLRKIENALEDIKYGRIYTTKEIKKRLGIR